MKTNAITTTFVDNMKRALISLSSLFVCTILFGCHPNSHLVEPEITYFTPQTFIDTLPTAFDALHAGEQTSDWGKHLMLGKNFAREMDYYRALTCFKSALFTIPAKKVERKQEIEYLIVQSYYLAGKYCEAIDAFENSSLMEVPPGFPAFHDLVIMLYDSYIWIGQPEKAYRILCLISQSDEGLAKDLALEVAICDADFPVLETMAQPDSRHHENLRTMLDTYQFTSKSVSKAQILNAVFPGAGYYYVGQKKSAITSFIINALFTAAAYQFFDKGYVAAGLITLSFEMGWYIGGINGAGLAAKEYNQHLYQGLGKEFLLCNRLFPVLMLQHSF